MKTLSLLSLLLLCQALIGQIDLEAGLVAYYPFSGNANDDSTFGNDANTIFEAGLIDGRNGEPNEAYFFDGINDHIIIPHADQINFDIQQPFTVSLWVKVPEEQVELAGGGNDIISKWTNSGTQPYPFVIRIFNQTSEFNGQIRVATFVGEFANCAFPYGMVITSNTAINDNEWHHIVFSRNEQGFLQLYIDCKLEGEIEDQATCTTQNNADLYIGLRVPSTLFRVFRGSVDELRIYDRTLNPEELGSICNVVSAQNEVKDLPEEKLVLFPNPLKSGSAIQAVIPESLTIKAITIFTPDGQNKGTFNIEKRLLLPAGFYLVQFSLEGRKEKILRKLIIME